MVVAIAQVCTTSSHPDPPGYAPSSDPLSPSSPPVGTGRRGDSQKRKFLYAQVNLPIRSINFLFPEFQAAYRAQSLTLAVAEYPPGPLTGVSADAEYPLRRQSG